MSADLRFKGRMIGQNIKRAEARKVSVYTMNPEMERTAKMSYLRGLVMGKGWAIQEDEKARFMVHILDQDGKDLSGPKTIAAAIEFVENQLDEEKE